MAAQDLTVDEAMQDILAALANVYIPVAPEGYKSIEEVYEASDKRLSKKQLGNNLNLAVDKGLMEKKRVGRRVYYKAKKVV